MDKTGIFVVSLCVAALVAWFVMQTRVEQEQARQQALFAATNHVALAHSPSTLSQPGSSNAPALSAVSSLSEETVPEPAIPAEILSFTNAHARYTFTSLGGGLKLVELTDYPETISARWRRQNESATNGFASLNTQAPLPVLAVFDQNPSAADQEFKLTRLTDGVMAEKDFSDGLVLTKTFHVTSNYLVNASITWSNALGHPVELPSQNIVVGTATPMDIDDNSTYLGSSWSDGETYQDITLNYFNTNTSTLGIIPRTPTPTYQAGSNNVLWAASHNQFFALLAMTPTNTPAQSVFARPLMLPLLAHPDANANQPLPRGIQTELVYPAATISASGSITRQITVFAGPKEFRTLSLIGEEFHNRADLAMNFGTGYTALWGLGTFFAKILLSAMNGLHDITGMGYGLAIVVITILLRLLFWPFTAASVRSAKKMQALAPEIKVLKEKYKDDPQKFTQKQMELWKKNKVNPMSGCFPMLIQMPVFFGFLAMIRCAIELRGAHFLWIADLTKPDTLFLIPGLDFPFNLLPLFMVGAMVWQAHLQPASPGMDPSQQKMMRYMPLMFLVFLYNYSSGMALYMTVSTLAGVLQTIVTRTKPIVTTTPVLTVLSKTKK